MPERWSALASDQSAPRRHSFYTVTLISLRREPLTLTGLIMLGNIQVNYLINTSLSFHRINAFAAVIFAIVVPVDYRVAIA